jgi:hypothetical protein
MILRIRHEQVDALAEARFEEFESRATGHLREFFPDKLSAMAADRLRAFLRRCVDRARAFGLTSEQAVVCFAHLSLLLGEGFDAEARWAFVPFLLRQEEYHQNDRAKAAMLLAYELKAKGR